MAQPDLKALKAVLIKYDVTICDCQDLLVLKDYDIVVIADDSGSMRHQINTGGTRWDELRKTVSQLVEIACCFDDDGIDVYFLNRGDIKGVRKPNDPQLVEKFSGQPNGTTPLGGTLARVLRDQTGQKPLLILIATDGVPNGGAGTVIPLIRSSIAQRKVRYQLLACSDQDKDIMWMNDLDEEFKEVDCTDDYQNEKQEILRVGLVKKFEKSDWLMKALLGPISKKFDSMDIGAHTSLQARGRTISGRLLRHAPNVQDQCCPAPRIRADAAAPNIDAEKNCVIL